MLHNILVAKNTLIEEISHFSIEDIHDTVEQVEKTKVSKVLLAIRDFNIVSSSTLALLVMINQTF